MHTDEKRRESEPQMRLGSSSYLRSSACICGSFIFNPSVLLRVHPWPIHSSSRTATIRPMSEQQKSWQSRIAEATDALAASFVESISYDRRIYKQDIAGSIAHATMLAKVGLITDAERDQIIERLKSIERDIESNNFTFDESLEDIHMVIEDALIKRIGEPGRKLHTGRSRNDQVALDIALWIDEAQHALQSAIEVLQRAFVELASRS